MVTPYPIISILSSVYQGLQTYTQNKPAPYPQHIHLFCIIDRKYTYLLKKNFIFFITENNCSYNTLFHVPVFCSCMSNHIILSAFGSTTGAKATYNLIGEQISSRFPDCRIHWAYSSPTIRSLSGDRQGSPLPSLPEAAAAIVNPGRIVVQSLHVLPGWEFQKIINEIKFLETNVALGMPLLSSNEDLYRLRHCLDPLIENATNNAVLILGHGTDHPCQNIFSDLADILKHRWGSRIFVSTIEYPQETPGSIVAQIAAAGYRNVLIIPLLLVAGMHFLRDINGSGRNSWKQMLSRHHINLCVHEHGLGMLPGIIDIYSDHIRAAFAPRKLS